MRQHTRSSCIPISMYILCAHGSTCTFNFQTCSHKEYELHQVMKGHEQSSEESQRQIISLQDEVHTCVHLCIQVYKYMCTFTGNTIRLLTDQISKVVPSVAVACTCTCICISALPIGKHPMQSLPYRTV